MQQELGVVTTREAPVNERGGEEGEEAHAIETMNLECIEQMRVNKKSSRFAARIIIEKKTQRAYVYAGAFDYTLEISLGVCDKLFAVSKRFCFIDITFLSLHFCSTLNVSGPMVNLCLTPGPVTEFDCGNRLAIRWKRSWKTISKGPTTGSKFPYSATFIISIRRGAWKRKKYWIKAVLYTFIQWIVFIKTIKRRSSNVAPTNSWTEPWLTFATMLCCGEALMDSPKCRYRVFSNVFKWKKNLL